MTTINISIKDILGVAKITKVTFRLLTQITIEGTVLVPGTLKFINTNSAGLATIQLFEGNYFVQVDRAIFKISVSGTGTANLVDLIALTPQTPLERGVPVGGNMNQVLGKLSSEDFDFGWINQTGGGEGSTNLSYTASPTQGQVNSDTGNDAVIPATDGTNAGLFLPTEKTKLTGITGTNTGDETTESILAKIGNGSIINDNYIPTSIARDSEILTKTLDGLTTVNSAVTSTNTIIEGFGRLQGQVNNKENSITAGTTSQYYRGDKTFQTLDKTAVGLANVDNTSDLNKSISTATQTALNLKQDALGFTPENVANKENTTLDTSTTKYPTNNLVKTNLDLKANLASPTFTGVITAHQIKTTKQTLTPAETTQTIDWNNGSIIDLILSSASGNVTLTLSNPQTATTYLIEVTNGATPRNLVFPTGTLQASGGGNVYVGTANQKDIIAVLWDGTQFLISVSRNFS